MLIVQRGWITHNGITYGRGQALPKMKRPEELRLIDLEVCIEGDIAILAPVVEEKEQTQIDKKEDEEEVIIPPSDVNLSFDPNENIKTKAK